ncbi:MAG: tetratricopeptide repeat protein, partial [Bacteroidales bacterium]|nr:tetratricopeptide repeat protein [Bacteroidales bacterium]
MRKFLILFFLVLSQIGFSQYQKNYSTKSKKAIKFFESAYRSYNSMKYQDALNYLDMAKKADKKFIEPYLLAANIFEENGYYQKEIDAYKTALSIDSNFSANTYYFLGETEYRMGFYADAVRHLKKVSDFDNLKPRIEKMAEIVLKRAEFAVQAVKTPVPFNPINLGDGINTKLDEYWP